MKNFALIVCTYMRPIPLLNLLNSVKTQTVYPNEILVIDGSTNKETDEILRQNKFQNLQYFLVSEKDRGLTRQRNFGISNTSSFSEIIFFLDDDTVLESNYFEEILKTYTTFPEALGVGGYISNEVKWQKVPENYIPNIDEFYYDGWKKKDGSRFVLRKKLGLDTDTKPGFMPEFSNGRSISCLPPSDKIYEVEHFMGGVSSFRKSVFESISFSNYFEGYGLYEDADFTLRLSNKGKLYVNTKAQLGHYHNEFGRPNKYSYGKMVVRNGWYVWRVKYPNPSIKARFKWNAISLLLIVIRISNIFTTSKKREALTESIGRIVGWFSLLYKRPILNNK
jgi:glycosyltransferase involved in cell wall biosynthesis